MPLYEYQCELCGKKFEVLQKFSDPPVTIHEECGGKVDRLISAPAFHLKGTGWYATDYAKNSNATPAKGDESKPADSKTQDSKPGDSKPAESKPAASESKSDSGAPAPAATPSA
jgi:putative FmdB family regulatory protein